MAQAIEIETDHTHFYPGAVGRLLAPRPGPAPFPVLVRFADGVTAEALLDGEVLTVAAYHTRARTAIPRKRWRVKLGDGPALRISARLP